MLKNYKTTLKSSYDITAREKFQVLKTLYPQKYFNRNICAKYIGTGRQIFKEKVVLEPLITNLIEHFNENGNTLLSDETKKKLIASIGFLIESNLDDYMKNTARDGKLRKEFKKRHDFFSNYIKKNAKTLAKKELNTLLVGIVLSEEINTLLDSYLDDIVERIFKKGSQTVNVWETKNGGIPNSEIRKKLARMFDMEYQIWEKEYPDVQSFKHDIETLKKPKKEDFKQKDKKLDKKILGEILPLPLNEESELEFISQVLPIKIPGNLATFSASFIFSLATLLKNHEQVTDALYVLDSLEKKVEPFVFYHRKKIQHLKAILLSHRSIQKWDEAIVVLRYLYADGYHFEKPEILTLLASNYKRKALYHPNGTLNYKEQVNIDLLQQANDLYEDAYDISKEDRYYHAINRAYMLLIIDAIEGNKEKKKYQREISTLYNELLVNGFPSNKKDWWQVSTQIEFLLLMQKENEAFDTWESYEGTPQIFEVETTIRQLEIYTHFTEEKIGKDFINVLRN